MALATAKRATSSESLATPQEVATAAKLADIFRQFFRPTSPASTLLGTKNVKFFWVQEDNLVGNPDGDLGIAVRSELFPSEPKNLYSKCAREAASAICHYQAQRLSSRAPIYPNDVLTLVLLEQLEALEVIAATRRHDLSLPMYLHLRLEYVQNVRGLVTDSYRSRQQVSAVFETLRSAYKTMLSIATDECQRTGLVAGLKQGEIGLRVQDLLQVLLRLANEVDLQPAPISLSSLQAGDTQLADSDSSLAKLLLWVVDQPAIRITLFNEELEAAWVGLDPVPVVRSKDLPPCLHQPRGGEDLDACHRVRHLGYLAYVLASLGLVFQQVSLLADAGLQALYNSKSSLLKVSEMLTVSLKTVANYLVALGHSSPREWVTGKEYFLQTAQTFIRIGQRCDELNAVQPELYQRLSGAEQETESTFQRDVGAAQNALNSFLNLMGTTSVSYNRACADTQATAPVTAPATAEPQSVRLNGISLINVSGQKILRKRQEVRQGSLVQDVQAIFNLLDAEVEQGCLEWWCKETCEYYVLDEESFFPWPETETRLKLRQVASQISINQISINQVSPDTMQVTIALTQGGKTCHLPNVPLSISNPFGDLQEYLVKENVALSDGLGLEYHDGSSWKTLCHAFADDIGSDRLRHEFLRVRVSTQLVLHDGSCNVSELAKRDDFYQVLGVRQDATQKEIRSAYLNLIKRFHPDKHTTRPLEQQREAAAFATFLNEVYRNLSDPDKRATYDRELKERSGWLTRLKRWFEEKKADWQVMFNNEDGKHRFRYLVGSIVVSMAGSGLFVAAAVGAGIPAILLGAFGAGCLVGGLGAGSYICNHAGERFSLSQMAFVGAVYGLLGGASGGGGIALAGAGLIGNLAGLGAAEGAMMGGGMGVAEAIADRIDPNSPHRTPLQTAIRLLLNVGAGAALGATAAGLHGLAAADNIAAAAAQPIQRAAVNSFTTGLLSAVQGTSKDRKDEDDSDQIREDPPALTM
eukprot:m.219274 g.219274  ORF g.219274 m.219274 type:complete len:981 (+) comp17229_c0_seq8:2005-4947(+)